MTLQRDAATTETAAARHAWLDDAAGDETFTPATPHRISIFGLGYVGAISLACLARDGHEMTGVDIDGAKLEMLRRGQAPIVETGTQELTRSVIRSGKVTVTDSARDAILASDVLVVATRTPEVLAALHTHTRPEQLLLDVAALSDREAHCAHYRGVCW